MAPNLLNYENVEAWEDTSFTIRHQISHRFSWQPHIQLAACVSTIGLRQGSLRGACSCLNTTEKLALSFHFKYLAYRIQSMSNSKESESSTLGPQRGPYDAKTHAGALAPLGTQRPCASLGLLGPTNLETERSLFGSQRLLPWWLQKRLQSDLGALLGAYLLLYFISVPT